MQASNVEVAKKGFEEYNRSGPAGVIDLMIRLDRLHPDYLVYVHDDLPTAGTYRGVEGYTKVTTEWDEVWSSFTITPKEIVEADEDRIMFVVDQQATAKGSGLTVDAEFFYVLLFKEGRFWQMHMYGDRESAERALEQAAPV